MNMEVIVFNLISFSGDARKASMEAISYAREGDFDKANICIMEATEKISEAHKIQSELIHKEAQGQHTEITLLLVHAQDYLMNAVTIKDLATEMIHMYKEIQLIK